MPTCLRTAISETDLIDIWLNIAADNPAAADKLLDRLEATFSLLADNPAMGPPRPDLAKELRYFAVGTYLILYRQITGGVEIVRVTHGARYLPDLI